MAQESSTTQKQVWESVDLFAVRCIVCSKWRIIPDKEIYEEIRENVAENYFVCETARKWGPHVSCEDESDIKEDANLIWAMDKPNIPRTPRDWQRIIRLRAEGGTKFADVYYAAPSNKRFRSMVELQRFLDDHPEYQQQHVSASRFSFQAPVPLDQNYVSKHGLVSASSALFPVTVNADSSANLEEQVSMECVGPNVASTHEVEAPEAEVNVLSDKDDSL